MTAATTPITLILGLGQSGLAMARWCVRAGQRVRVADSRENPPQLAALAALLDADGQAPEFVAGPFDGAVLQGVQAVYCSPGLSPLTVEPVRQTAVQTGVFFGGELDLFSQGLAQLLHSQAYAPKVLAITGTNGKTTVTSLTGLLVERAGLSVAVAGNIGPSLLDTLSQKMDAQALPDVWVLELSSFQLAYSSGFEPTAGTVLNITQDHLDWHSDLADYASSKAKVFGSRGVAVVNRDDPAVMELIAQEQARNAAPIVSKLTGRTRTKVLPPRTVVSFGLDAPEKAQDWGVVQVNGMDWLAKACSDTVDEGSKRKNRVAPEVYLQRLMPADAMRLRGRHNASNALAALALATAAGAALAPMLYGLREYRGEPHRVQLITTIAGVEYFDDSKGTNIGATAAALSGLGAARKLVVILGGEGKGQDFAQLLEPVRQHARAVVLIGRDAALIEHALQSSGVPQVHAPTLEAAVQQCAALASHGDAVLLSPACASFDMFKGYEHRAQVFVEAVRTLAHAHGQELEVFA